MKVTERTRTIDIRERIARLASGAVIVASICYWIAQIVGVIEMLRLAYG